MDNLRKIVWSSGNIIDVPENQDEKFYLKATPGNNLSPLGNLLDLKMISDKKHKQRFEVMFEVPYEKPWEIGYPYFSVPTIDNINLVSQKSKVKIVLKNAVAHCVFADEEDPDCFYFGTPAEHLEHICIAGSKRTQILFFKKVDYNKIAKEYRNDNLEYDPIFENFYGGIFDFEVKERLKDLKILSEREILGPRNEPYLCFIYSNNN